MQVFTTLWLSDTKALLLWNYIGKLHHLILWIHQLCCFFSGTSCFGLMLIHGQVKSNGLLQRHVHLLHWLLPLQMSQQSQHWFQWQQKHSLQQMPSPMLEHLTSQMLEHSLQKILAFSYGQTVNNKANLVKYTIYLGCSMDMSELLLTCINDEPSGMDSLLLLDDAAMDFPLVCFDCAGSICNGLEWLALVAGGLYDPACSCCCKMSKDQVSKMSKEWI